MKNIDKLMRLALMCAALLTGEQIFTRPPETHKNKAQLQTAAQQAAAQKQTGIVPSAPPFDPSPMTPPSQPISTKGSTTPNQSKKLTPPARKSASNTKTQLSKEDMSHLKKAASAVSSIWQIYRLNISNLRPDEELDQRNFDEIKKNLYNLRENIVPLKNKELVNLLELLEKSVVNSFYDIETIAIDLYNLIITINEFAGTNYDLIGISEYIKITSDENPLYAGYVQATDYVTSALSPLTNAWSSTQSAASSLWQRAKQGVQQVKSFVGQPTQDEFDKATYRLNEIKRIQSIDIKDRKQTDINLLKEYKKTEAADKALVGQWWPTFVTVAGLGAFYYLFPEFSKNVASYGLSGAGYFAKPALKAGAVYGGYRLLTDKPETEQQKKKIDRLKARKTQQQ